MRLRKPLILKAAAIFISFVAVVGIWIKTFGLHRPYFNWDPEDLATYLIENERSPEECWDLVVFDPFGPQAGNQRSLCIFTMAQKNVDPTICNFLMPSEYGLACTSYMWPDVSGHEACGLDHSDKNVFWCRDKNGVLHESRNCQDFIGNEKQFSICLYYTAYKNKDLSECGNIPDQTIRSLCIIEFEAWEKYPELQNSIYFGGSGS